jgi:hypothetical protein
MPDLTPGDSADVRFPPRSKRLTARFLRAEPNGDLTFVHPRNGALRTVHPEQVGRIRRTSTSTTTGKIQKGTLI